MKKAIIPILIALVFLGGCTNSVEDPVDFPTSCSNAGGNYNDCSSPCLGTDSEICITVCQEACECLQTNDYSCPDDYNCRYIEGQEKGACVENG